jgi:hypothetical protein
MIRRINAYDRQGNPISDEEYSAIIEGDLAFDTKRVAETTLPNGVWVSTVWLGIDHNWGHIGPPLIFETMVFENGDIGADLRMARYSTEEEALKGHEEMVEWAKEWTREDP